MPVKELLLFPLWANRRVCDFPCPSAVSSCFDLWRIFPLRSCSEIVEATTWFHTVKSESEDWAFVIDQWSYIMSLAFMENEIQSVNSEGPRGSTYTYPYFNSLLFFFHRLGFLSLSVFFFPSVVSFCRPLRGGRTWWWSTPRLSCASTLPTWMQPLKFNPLTAGTVFPSSNYWMTTWGWTVSGALMNLCQQSVQRAKWLTMRD